MTWGYFWRALVTAAVIYLAIFGPALIGLYLGSSFHRRGVTRLRGHQQRQEPRT